MEVVEDRRSHIAARIAANKNVLDMLLEQAQVGGLDDGLRFQIKRTRQILGTLRPCSRNWMPVTQEAYNKTVFDRKHFSRSGLPRRRSSPGIACGLAETCACALERQLCLGLLCQPEPSLSHRYQQHLVLGISNVISNA
jgi:hypothetical protein